MSTAPTGRFTVAASSLDPKEIQEACWKLGGLDNLSGGRLAKCRFCTGTQQTVQRPTPQHNSQTITQDEKHNTGNFQETQERLEASALDSQPVIPLSRVLHNDDLKYLAPL